MKVRGKIDLMRALANGYFRSRVASSFSLLTLYQIREVLVPQILEVLRRQLHQLTCDTRVPVLASRLGLTDHLNEHHTSVLRGRDLLEEIDASTLNPISRLQP